MRSHSQPTRNEKLVDQDALLKSQDLGNQVQIKTPTKSNNQNGKETQFLNGRARTTPKVNYETYYSYKEEAPAHFHPLLQYLDVTELKFANDNLYNNSPHGFPTRAL
jgi:hypothetical protein